MIRDDLSAICGCGAGAASACDAALPDDPQCATNFHFGMLLGVDEFRTEQGFHVGHARRHQRLLHGHGVVSGYAVSFDPAARELRVGPGFAVDLLGRDLALATPQCVNLVDWWAKHRDDEAFGELVDKDDATLELELVAHYDNCLDRAVPAIADPCAGNTPDIAYARVCEAVRLELRRTPPPAAPLPPGHRLLRVWLGMAPAEAQDQWLLDRYAAAVQLPLPQQAAARAALLREVLARAVSAEDAMAPEAEPDGANLALVLARLHRVHFFPGADGPTVALAEGDIERGAREVLLPLSVLQGLLLAEPAPTPAAAGPVLRPGGATLSGLVVQALFNQPLEPSTATAASLQVSEFVAGSGWTAFAPTIAVDNGAAGGPTVHLSLDRAPLVASQLRLTVLGQGPSPLLGSNLVPAGAASPGGDGRMHSTAIVRT